MSQPTRRSSRRQGTRPSSNRQSRSAPQRQVVIRAAPEPVDYSQDYLFVRRDLQWIAIWSAVLFAGMFAYFFISHTIS